MEYIKLNGDEFYHYGVPGMKWGKRTQSFLKSAPVQSFARKVAELNGTIPNSQRAAKKADKVARVKAEKAAKKAQKQSTPHRKAKIGAAVVGGILAGNLAAAAASNVTINKPTLLAVSLTTSVLSGKKMYELMTEPKTEQK